jgi:hypothetical protein
VGVALLDLQIDDMAPIAGVADAPDAQPSVLRNLWASVLMMALYGATDATPSRQRDEARWYLTMRNNADLTVRDRCCWIGRACFQRPHRDVSRERLARYRAMATRPTSRP